MEYNFRDFENLERLSPILEIDFGGRVLQLTYENTAIFSFSEPYKDFTSIFHNDPDIGVITMYDSDALLEQLRGYRYPEYCEPYPDPKTIDSYFEWHSRVLFGELGRIATGDLSDLTDEEPEPDDDDDDPPGYRPSDWGFDD